MILYTSDIESSKRRYARTSLCYLAVSVLCIVFSLVYEKFSYGEYSVFMRNMFLFPLLGGMLPAIILQLTGKTASVNRVSFNMWNAGIAVFVSGCLVRGVINISGRFTEYDKWYWIAGGGMLVLAAAVGLAGRHAACQGRDRRL
ncbi:hypothetical protein [Murimonas intestini]|uniref:hypothetical protein n=1 Tax=Murimonas intestini TaxID=1337051 RepID=UPI0011DDFC9E|nr:hypothetical protein [Murimonas intestini]